MTYEETRKTGCKYEMAMYRAMRRKKEITAITRALGYNEDFDWDKTWVWYESPKRTLSQTKTMLRKIGVTIKG